MSVHWLGRGPGHVSRSGGSTSGGTGNLNALLREDGTFVLREDGSYLLREDSLPSIIYDTSIGNGVDTAGFASLPLRLTVAKRIYVGSGGSDANTGLSHAQRVLTVAKARTLWTDGTGDQILFAQGSAFAEPPPDMGFVAGGFSLLYPTVFQSYDPADPTNEAKMGRASGSNRPTFSQCFNYFGGTGQKYIAMRGLDINPGNVSAQANGATDITDGWLFENCLFRYSGVTLKIGTTQNVSKHWIFRNCAIYGAWWSGSDNQGLYFSGGWGTTVEDCVIYHSGWKIGGAGRDSGTEGASIFSHSVYQQHTAKGIFRRNLIIDGSADGGSHRDDTLIQGNVYLDNPIQVSAGGGNGVDAASPFGDALEVSYNAILGGADINSTSTRGWGIDTFNGKTFSLARYNVLAHNTGTGAKSTFSMGGADNVPSYMTFDHNVSYQFSTSGNAYQKNPNFPAQDFATFTNNIWDDPASGSNINIASGVFPNSSLDVAALCTAAGYANKAALAQYAIDHPEQRIQRTLYPIIMAAYGQPTSVFPLIDLAMETSWRTGNKDAGTIVGTQDGSNLAFSNFPASVTFDSNTRMWWIDGTASTASSGTGTVIETRSDGTTHSTNLAWTISLAPQLSAASVPTVGSTTATLQVTTDIGNGTLYWILDDTALGKLYPGEVKLGRSFNYYTFPKSGSQAVSGTGVQSISVTGLTPGQSLNFLAMQVSGAGVWSATTDGLHAIGPVTFTPTAAGSTWNPADKASQTTLTSGNLDATIQDLGTYNNVRGTTSKSSGKWYAEVLVGTTPTNAGFGVANASADLNNYLGSTLTTGMAYFNTGFIPNGAFSPATYVAVAVIGVAVDRDAGKIYFAKNNVWQDGGDPVAGTGGETSPTGALFLACGGTGGDFTLRPTAASQTYAPPTGFTAWG